MDTALLPPHSLISSGKIHPKSQPSLKCYTPKVIAYKHTIRVITPFQCTHHSTISQLTSKHQQQIGKKDRLIEQLLEKIKSKEEALLEKAEEINRLTNDLKKDECATMSTSIVQNIFQQNEGFDLLGSVAQSLPNLSFARESFLSNRIPNSQLQIPPPDKRICSNQFERIQKTISELAKLTSKDKKKYQFFSEQFKQRMSSLTFKDSQKFEAVANQQTERTNLLEDEFQNQSTNESIDTQGFYQTMMRQHQYLKEVLIELQSSTKMQIQQMKQNYERQIIQLQGQLTLQRQKNKRINTGPSRYKKVFQAEIQQLKQSRVYRESQFDWSEASRLLSINSKDLRNVLDND